MKTVAEQLVQAGMSPHEADSKARMFHNCEAILRSKPTSSWFVPGRIEVLGKHTDYAGGRSLLCAAERGMCIVAAARTDSTVNITDSVTRQSVEFKLSADIQIPPYGWTVYPMTVARRIARNFPGTLTGADIVLASDLPRASGMSSSSVLVTAVFTILSALNDLGSHPQYLANIHLPEDLAGYLGCVENGQTFRTLQGDTGVGTFGGSEDHTAILCCQSGQLAQYSFCPVRFERTASVPRETVFVIGTSGVSAPKTGSAKESYNSVSRSARAVLACWHSYSGEFSTTLAEAVTSSADAPNRIRDALLHVNAADFSGEFLSQRFEQFLLESEFIIPRAAEALDLGDLRTFGTLVDRSQAAAERALGNQVPETISLARSARALGAHAASAFGAGFGGSVWALIDRATAEAFCSAWRERYVKDFPECARSCHFFLTSAGPSLLRIL